MHQRQLPCPDLPVHYHIKRIGLFGIVEMDDFTGESDPPIVMDGGVAFEGLLPRKVGLA